MRQSTWPQFKEERFRIMAELPLRPKCGWDDGSGLCVEKLLDEIQEVFASLPPGVEARLGRKGEDQPIVFGGEIPVELGIDPFDLGASADEKLVTLKGPESVPSLPPYVAILCGVSLGRILAVLLGRWTASDEASF